MALGIQGGLEKWPVNLGFASGDRSFFQTPLNPSSQILSPVTLLISHYLYTITLYSFPENLKHAEISPIYKKGNVMEVSNYRPVSVLPSISKIFEKAIVSQLNDYFDGISVIFCLDLDPDIVAKLFF